MIPHLVETGILSSFFSSAIVVEEPRPSTTYTTEVARIIAVLSDGSFAVLSDGSILVIIRPTDSYKKKKTAVGIIASLQVYSIGSSDLVSTSIALTTINHSFL